MAVNFPDNPSNGDTTVVNGVTYTYNATNNLWKAGSSSSGGGGGGTTAYATAAELPQTATNGDLALVEETDKLYIWNDTAWYNIALINTAPSITQGGAGSYNLAIDGTPTVITLTATDPESVPVTWSYAVTSGSLTNGGGTTATVTQADNVFTITPTTTEAYAGTFTLTFSVTDGANIVNDVNSFTLNFITIVDDSAPTTLLLKTDATSIDNQVDASSNSFVIAETGNITSTALTPYHPKGYSVYLDGTGDYFRTGTSAGMDFGTGDFTIEFWINQSSYNSGDVVADGRAVWNDNGWSIETKNNGIQFYSSGGIVSTTSGTDFSTQTNQWIHVAVVRNSGTVTTYINGTNEGSVSYSTGIDTTGSVIYIGRRSDGNTSFDFNGYISDFRIVSSAVYTTDFTPPTERLTAITNTELLTCHAPYISDGSTNLLTTPITGNTTTVQISPYDHDPYNKLDFGGSVYFDGSGDYMSISANDAFSFGAGDFTLEAWVYVDAAEITTSNIPLVGWDTGSYKIIRLNSSGINVESNSPSNISFTVGFPETPVSKVWNHIALVRSGNSFTAYLNGRGGTPYTYSGNVGNGTDQLNIGYKSDPTYYNGWMADLRIVKGTAVYTSNFVPPTEPLTAISGTSLLTCTNKNSVWDASSGSSLTLGGNTSASTTQTKYASSSIYFDGSGDYIAKPSSSLISMGSGDYTVELWAYFNSLPTAGNGWHMIFAARDGSDNGVAFYVDGPTPHVELYTNALVATGTTTLSTGQWYHLAYVRTNGTGKVYINGTEDISYSYTTSVGDATLYIAGFTSQFANMYIEDFRITKGLARYTANFTPPTGALEG